MQDTLLLTLILTFKRLDDVTRANCIVVSGYMTRIKRVSINATLNQGITQPRIIGG